MGAFLGAAFSRRNNLTPEQTVQQIESNRGPFEPAQRSRLAQDIGKIAPRLRDNTGGGGSLAGSRAPSLASSSGQAGARRSADRRGGVGR